jgi:hypothetical protein
MMMNAYILCNRRPSSSGRTEKLKQSQNDRLLYFGLQPVAENHVNFLSLAQSGYKLVAEYCGHVRLSGANLDAV